MFWLWIGLAVSLGVIAYALSNGKTRRERLVDGMVLLGVIASVVGLVHLYIATVHTEVGAKLYLVMYLALIIVPALLWFFKWRKQ